MSDKTLFIIGAGRSGTTLLHKLFSLSAEIGFLSNYDEQLPSWFPSGLLTRALIPHLNTKSDSWFSNNGNAYFVKRPWISKIIPTPSEGEFLYRDCGIPNIPDENYKISTASKLCLQKRVNKISKQTGAKVFVLKRTANNRRIPILDDTFPDALYINIVRDGREVADSLSKVSWWDEDVVFWAEKKPRELEKEGWHPLAICANNWLQEVNQINKDLPEIDAKRQVSIRYEDLISNPLITLNKLFDFLGLEFPTQYSDKIKSFEIKPRPPKWKSAWTPEELKEVMQIQQPLLHELGYL